jgi:surface antigen
MKKIAVVALSATLVGSLLTGCNATRQDWGIVGGAVVGGLIAPVIFGNSAWYTVVGGAATGAWVGNYFGKGMDRNDHARVGYTLNKAPDRQPYQFMKSSDQKNHLTVTPTKTYRVNDQVCRDFETTLNDQGKTVYEKGSACQQSTGGWKLRA